MPSAKAELELIRGDSSDAHSRLIRDLGLNENHFDYVAEDLVSVLKGFNVPEDIIGDVVKTVSPLRELFTVE